MGVSASATTGVVGAGTPGALLDDEELLALLEEGLRAEVGNGERVLVLVPDRTRTFPTARCCKLLRRVLSGRVRALDYLVATGTHAPVPERDLARLVGVDLENFPGLLVNHRYDDDSGLVQVGMVGAEEVSTLSTGRLALDVPIRINALTLRYDRLLICGPVFPHEVVGFSGGNKYLFPGVSGPELIDVSHWLGALETSRAIIGREGTTAVRALIDLAASRVPVARTCVAAVSTPASELEGCYIGCPEDAWAAAAHLAAATHVQLLSTPAERVISLAPARYPDMWTAAKAMYKLEPVVADGGELVVVAPHVREFSSVHGTEIARVGYHVRDYFLAQWDRFAGIPWKILAHSTHLKGDGTYDAVAGEQPRIRVTLATGIPEEVCRAHALGWADPMSPLLREVQSRQTQSREPVGDPATLVVPDAGEILYRLEAE